MTYTFVYLLSVVFAKYGYMFVAVLIVSSQIEMEITPSVHLLPY